MILSFDEYELDTERLDLTRAGTPVRADRMVLRLLAALLHEAGRLVTKAQLMEQVWERRAVSENVLSVSITRLRKTLGHKSGEREFVVSVQGRGYRFVRPVTIRAPSAEIVLDAALPGFGTAAPLVGRESVLRRLRSSLSAAREGRGGVCLLTGEAGIGKTAAAEQLARDAEAQGVRVCWSYCQEVGETPPLWPFTQLVRTLLATEGEPAALSPELRWLLPGLATEGERGPPAAKYRVFEAILDVLERAASERGCLLVLDDLHRADAASLELLRYWMDRLARTRVLLVGTLRGLRSPHSLAELDLRYVVGHRNCARIALARLEPAAVEAYVASILPDPEQTLGREVWTKSEGNPFFMVELARQLADAEHPCASDLRVSEQALELLRPRVRELDAATRGLLSTASVIGRRFELRLLQSVTDQPRDVLTEYLDAAVASELVVPAAEASTAFAFGHELIRQLLYDGLVPQQRRKLHLTIGQTLADWSQRGEVVPSAVLAYHFHAALPESCPLTTLYHCQRAALDATLVFAHGDGMRYLQHALEALSLSEQPNPRARVMLLLQLAVGARLAGAPEFEQRVHDAVEVARAAHSGALLLDVAMLLHLHPGFPTSPEARALLEEGLAMLPAGETIYRSAALARLATCGPVAFDAARSRAQLAEALSLMRSGDPLIPTYNVHSAAHYLTSGPGSDDLTSATAIERMCRENPSMLRVAPTLLDLHAAIVAYQRGQLEAAEAALAQAATRCHEMQTRELTWCVERYRLLARLSHESRADIAMPLRLLHERAERESIIGSELMCIFDRVVVLEQTVDAWTLRRVLGYSPDDPPSIWSMKLQTLAAAGLHDEARAALGAVSADALASLPSDRDYVGTLGALAQAAITLDAREHMAALDALLAPYQEYLSVHVSFLCLGPVARLRGELAFALGRPDEGRAHFARAARIARRLAIPTHVETAQRALASLG